MNLFKKKDPNEKKPMSKKKKKIIKVSIIAVVILTVSLIGVKAFLSKKSKDTASAVNTAEARIGNVKSSISASGTIEPIDKYEVMSLVKGDVLMDTFKEGDIVEKDSVLYQIDTTEIQSNVEKAKLSMEKTQNTYKSSMDSLKDLEVKAPINGVITQVYVKLGDSVSNGAKICELVDHSKMILTVPFNSSDSTNIFNGASAKVTLENSFYSTYGTVKRVSSGSVANENNVSIIYADIEVDNPGAILKGDKATAVIGDVACNQAGTFDYNQSKTVTAEVAGDIKALYNSTGDQMYEGGIIASIESKSVSDSVKSSDISLREAQISLQNVYDQLDNYTIKAPIGGTVIEKTVKAGDTIDNTTSKTTMCVIADLSTIVFTINVDELDIEKVKLDQKVDITADALPNAKFVGYVNNININGTTSNGVTTYPVKIVVENPQELLPGMNVNAEIVIEEKSDVLVVPVSAVMRGNTVYVKNGEKSDKSKNSKKANDTPEQSKMPENNKGNASAKNNANKNTKNIPSQIPEGFKAVKVTTGINDENNIEIVSGLNEGDIVYVKSAAATNNNFMMPGMGAGMPAGGGAPGTVRVQTSGTSSGKTGTSGTKQ